MVEEKAPESGVFDNSIPFSESVKSEDGDNFMPLKLTEAFSDIVNEAPFCAEKTTPCAWVDIEKINKVKQIMQIWNVFQFIFVYSKI